MGFEFPDKCIANARAEAENLLARSKSELELAARDVILRLREALGRALEAILAARVKEKLSDGEFLSQTLHDLVMLYAKAEIGRKETMTINVSPELQSKLADWALKEMTQKAQEADMGIDLKGSLSAVGFEYQISGATVEVTLESVVEALSELVSPRLREVIDKAAGDFQPQGDKAPSQ